MKLDHCVLAVSDWERSNRFYEKVLKAEVVPLGRMFAYRFGDAQLNVHGPGLTVGPQQLAVKPVVPGNSDLCFRWEGPIQGAVDHLERCEVPIEHGPALTFGARGYAVSVYFRDPDGSLLELISYDEPREKYRHA
jgi:catechol 2,3-dioxygenase-like lactoylglutathione lyase family enzyme